jgi:hypothetical protein
MVKQHEHLEGWHQDTLKLMQSSIRPYIYTAPICHKTRGRKTLCPDSGIRIYKCLSKPQKCQRNILKQLSTSGNK